ncbi:hypothetical protein ACFL4W_03980 [Planctomycetota bacterium]
MREKGAIIVCILAGILLLPAVVSAVEAVEAKALFKAFLENEASANKQYKGKTLDITGKVRHIGKDFAKKTFIQLIGGGIFHNVRCMMTDPAQAADVSKGQTIELRGRCDGRRGDVVVKDCQLLGASGAPAAPAPAGEAPDLIKAHDLITAFNTNEVNADTRFKGKIFEVTGQVNNVGKVFGKPFVNVSTPKRMWFVKCILLDAEVAAKLTKGMAITVKGTCNGKPGGEVIMDKCTVTSEPAGAPLPEGGMSLPVNSFYDAYMGNQIAADGKYKGQVVELTGKIRFIAKGLKKNYYVALDPGKPLVNVRCFLADPMTAVHLSKKQEVKITGKVKGRILAEVELTDCTVLTPTPPKAKKVLKAAPVGPFTMDVDQIFKEYDNNEIMSNINYKDKSMTITGTVTAVNTNIGGKTYVDLAALKSPLQMIRCFLTDTGSVGALRRGVRATVVGTCKGRPGLVVEIHGCTVPGAVAAPQPAPAGPVSLDLAAKDLFKEYAANAVNADAKYKNKTLTVSGKVRAIQKGFGGRFFVVMVAGNPFQSVKIWFKDKDASAKVTKGQAIKVKGLCKGKLGGMVELRQAVLQ